MSKGTKKGKNNGIAVLVIFMVIGFAMAIGGIVMTVDRKHKDSYYGTAAGKITDISHHTDSDGDDMYAAVYTYYVDDIEYTFIDDTSSSARPSIGKRVDIRYNPEHPEIAYIGGRVWMGVILLGNFHPRTSPYAHLPHTGTARICCGLALQVLCRSSPLYNPSRSLPSRLFP